MSDNTDKHLQKMFIAQCHICQLASNMRHCNECKFNIGLEYWLCDCDILLKPRDTMRHKSEMFCTHCDAERPKDKFRLPAMSNDEILKQLGY